MFNDLKTTEDRVGKSGSFGFTIFAVILTITGLVVIGEITGLTNAFINSFN
jgi:hypothetical protein